MFEFFLIDDIFPLRPVEVVGGVSITSDALPDGNW